MATIEVEVALLRPPIRRGGHSCRRRRVGPGRLAALVGLPGCGCHSASATPCHKTVRETQRGVNMVLHLAASAGTSDQSLVVLRVPAASPHGGGSRRHPIGALHVERTSPACAVVVGRRSGWPLSSTVIDGQCWPLAVRDRTTGAWRSPRRCSAERPGPRGRTRIPRRRCIPRGWDALCPSTGHILGGV